jgi:hypothetical protein
MKLFGLLRRGHAPDIDALSAYVDGALDAGAARALQDHLSACPACVAELDGLRRVKALLAALPEAEPRRSFRLRQADVMAPPAPARAPAGGLLRAMPALAAAAAAIFVGVLATDLSTRDGGGERQAVTRNSDNGAAESAAMSDADQALEYRVGDDTTNASDPPAAGALHSTPDAAAAERELAPAGEQTRPDDAEPPVAADAPGGAADAAEGDGLAGDGQAATSLPAESIEAANADTAADDDDGNRWGFLAVEVIAGVLAVAAAAAFISNRSRRSEG